MPPYSLRRGEFKEWSVTLMVFYDDEAFTPDVIRALFDAAGKINGVGTCRPAKGGPFGRWKVRSFRVRRSSEAIVRLRSTDSLIVSRFDGCAAYGPRRPRRRWRDNLYKIGRRYGFPAYGFKLALIETASCFLRGRALSRKVRRFIHIGGNGDGLVLIDGIPSERVDRVRVQQQPQQ